jgi:hypothetical protein
MTHRAGRGRPKTSSEQPISAWSLSRARTGGHPLPSLSMTYENEHRDFPRSEWLESNPLGVAPGDTPLAEHLQTLGH